ncbi:hypothetical protein ADEAN_000846900 [Angomonas deanei]|uniref:Uncharacterized protein n=1 Tax=Angomonas deanei TaxID=59799 RepID=A0A7G2CNC1_9TRYP|nr:hypothetical protein ADEAN_000846900 [Angomonas deanei]
MSTRVVCIPATDKKLLEQIKANSEFVSKNPLAAELTVADTVPDRLVHTVSEGAQVSGLLEEVWRRKTHMEGETHEPTQSIAPECPESLRLFAVQLTDGGQPLCLTSETKLSEVTARTDVLRLGDEADSPVVLLYADEESMGGDASGIAMIIICGMTLVCMLIACLTPICIQCCEAREEKKQAKKDEKKRKKEEKKVQKQQEENQNSNQYYNYYDTQQQPQQGATYGAPPVYYGNTVTYGAPPANVGYGVPLNNEVHAPTYGQPTPSKPVDTHPVTTPTPL